LKKFKSIQPFRIYEHKDSKVIDRINWTAGLQETELDGQLYLVEVKRLVPPGVKSFEEARAGVISDYQDQLEKQWITELKEKFPVKVNNKGKKYVLAELTQ
jgi:peptidyl-prolyl cis-trans isomerase SurA